MSIADQFGLVISIVSVVGYVSFIRCLGTSFVEEPVRRRRVPARRTR